MADNRLADFPAASGFAIRAAGFPGLLRLLADYDMTKAVARQVREMHSGWKRHRELLETFDDRLSGISDDIIGWPGHYHSNAHKAALNVAWGILSNIEYGLMIGGVIDKSAVTVAPELPLADVSLIESHWPIVRKAILGSPPFDASAVEAYIARERGKLLERLSPPLEGVEVAERSPATGGGDTRNHAQKKIKATPDTLKIIRLIEKNYTNDRIFDELGESVAKSIGNIRKVRTLLGQGRYTL